MATSRRKKSGPSPRAQADLEAAREEGREQARAQNGAAIEQLRADAAALERSSDVLADASLLSSMGAGETCKMLRTLAAGMRLAADRIPDSPEIPF